MSPRLRQNLARLPAGTHGIAISGHADSTALLCIMLAARPDCPLHLIHLDHQLRGDASTGDAAFVVSLAQNFNLPLTLERLNALEPTIPDLPNNPSARYRALRHALFQRVTSEHALAGILLAHHADDQAETILQRLLRNASPPGLAGMSFLTRLPGLSLYRPLLESRKTELLAHLQSIGQSFREDASNTSPQYQRNRVRSFLQNNPKLIPPLLDLATHLRSYRDWIQTHAPTLGDSFPTSQLADLPHPLALESARRWLMTHHANPDDLSPATLQRLIDMCIDASTPPRCNFPSGLLVKRRRKVISVQPAPVT